MFKPFQKSAPEASSVARIQAWTRERFDLGADSVVMVADVRCQVPGCPPVETVVAFWDQSDTRYRFKVFKPVADVDIDDIPVKWLLPALEDYDDLGCDCC